MSTFQQIIILGNVGKDPEVRQMANGTTVVNLSVATSEHWKDKQTGEKKERTEWHRCSAFGNVADIIAKYVKRGDKVHLTGTLQTRKWQADDGSDRYTTEVKVRDVTLMGSQSASTGQQGSGHGQRQQSAPAASQEPSDTFADMDDDIPF